MIQKDPADLKIYIEKKLKREKDENLSAHFTLALERMKAPEKAKPLLHREIPPGGPIGCEMEW